jgi:hypothetical protein
MIRKWHPGLWTLTLVFAMVAFLFQFSSQACAQTSDNEKWKPSGKQILDFVDKSLKSNVDRAKIEQVLDDISTGKAVLLSEKEAAAKDKAKGLAAGNCIAMQCRSRPCAVDYGNGRYGCSTCCIAAQSGRNVGNSSDLQACGNSGASEEGTLELATH